VKDRSRTLELLDVETPRGEELARLAGYLAFVNRWLGATSAVAHHLRGLPSPATVLDVGAGAGDIARALVRRFPGLRPVAVDLSWGLLELAADFPRVRGDARRLPFRNGSVDAVVSTHLFHHLTDDDAVEALREFARVARRRVVVNDLLRRKRAVLWIRFLTLFANRFARADGPLSVRRGFTLPEVESLARRAGLRWLRTREHFGHRFTLAGERPPG
jgi:SAM-dependent methyltransferase